MEQLTKTDIENIYFDTENDFSFNYSKHIYNIHDQLLNYCNHQGLKIYDQFSSSNELYTFLKDHTNLYQNLLNKNIEKELKNIEDIDDEYNN